MKLIKDGVNIKNIYQNINTKEYIKAIRWELDEWLKCGMEDYLLTASKLVEEGVKLGGVCN